jgi:hypothetical protein
MFLCDVKTITEMKKLVSNLNPFILLLIPVMIALVMGINYQVEQAKEFAADSTIAHATSLFHKSVVVVKAVCEIAQQNIW